MGRGLTEDAEVIELLNGNALRIPLSDGSVQMCVTSPPYWGLRDYGTAEWSGGDEGCEHFEKKARNDAGGEFRPGRQEPEKIQYRDTCAKCGAVRIDKQLGLEPTIDCEAWRKTERFTGEYREEWTDDEDEDSDGNRVFFRVKKLIPVMEYGQKEPCGNCYICNMVAVFREVWRVMRDDGVCFINLGDSYAANPAGNFGNGSKPGDGGAYRQNKPKSNYGNLKPKDLCGVPWRVAFALQADGWYLRSDIIWSKSNPMPESVTDRPTKSHEYIFLLTKRGRYYWDQEAVRECQKEPERSKPKAEYRESHGTKERKGPMERWSATRHREYNPSGRNLRTVWNIATQPYSGAHFATYPEKLAETCIKAGTSERGCCPVCGQSWVRVVEKGELMGRSAGDGVGYVLPKAGIDADAYYPKSTETYKPNHKRDTTTLGWRPDCDHDAEPVSSIVLDPFAGSGTSLLVAKRLGRSAVGLDLSYEYLRENAWKRVGMMQPVMF